MAAGLVASLGRPGGNATGMTLISVVLGQKRLEILREIAPKASVVAMLANPISPDAVPEIGTVQSTSVRRASSTPPSPQLRSDGLTPFLWARILCSSISATRS